MKKIKISKIVDFLKCEFIGDLGGEIKGFSSCDSLKLGCLTFLINDYNLNPGFGAVLLDEAGYCKRPRDFGNYLIVDNPKLCFARVLREFYESSHKPEIIFSGPKDNTLEGKVHRTVEIEGNVYLDFTVKIQPFVSIGTEGFGHVKNEKGEWEEFPQIGGVRIGENVEIAAGCNIHRGTLDDTTIGEGTKISTHCNIGHNCQIGKHVFIGGNTNLGGGTKIGDYSFIGMRVVTGPQTKIGKHVAVGMGSVVTKDLPDNALAYGNPAKLY